jgi:hypothetical protein
MLIGSNNSLTYLRPSSWWSKIFKIFGRCQELTYFEQYEYCGVRLFDLRLYADKHLHIIAKNGKFKYSIFSLYEILNYLDKKGDVTVKITFGASLNDSKSDIEYLRIENKFMQICKIVETIYPNINYIGGRRAFDDKLLHEFNYEKEHGTPKIIYETSNNILYKLFPILLAMKNKKSIQKYENENIFLLLDYVNKK